MFRDFGGIEYIGVFYISFLNRPLTEVMGYGKVRGMLLTNGFSRLEKRLRGNRMSKRSYTKIWLHLIWGTYNREQSLISRKLRKELSEFYYEYAEEKGIYMKINYVNVDHIHMLIDLPTNKTIEEIIRLLKGASSRWLNQQITYRFSWSKGYAALSVSEWNLKKVKEYIKNQEEHHKAKSFKEEYVEFYNK